MALSDHGRGADQFMLRLPDGLRQRVKDSAQSNGRSMNAELVIRVEASFLNISSLHQEIASLIERRVEAEVSARLAKIAMALGGNASEGRS